MKSLYVNTGFRWSICLERQLSPFVWQVFMPTTFMVALTWISFLIPPSCYPGRISLLVTIVLCLINVMTSEMQQSPESNGLNAINCWFLICLVLVAIASLEYAIILYFMRFNKEKVHSGNIRSKAKTENISEINQAWFKKANSIDYCSLLFIPSLFIFTAFSYFLIYLNVTPNC